jgi:hypothetical protein
MKRKEVMRDNMNVVKKKTALPVCETGKTAQINR